MTPVITKPTRITDHTITLIYHIYTNASISQIISGIALFDISDHLPVFCAINTPIKQSQERNYFRDYKSFNRELYLNDVRQLNWNAMTDASEVAKSTAKTLLRGRLHGTLSTPWLNSVLLTGLKFQSCL